MGHLYSPCPYNAQHIILKSELSHHKSKCPDKVIFRTLFQTDIFMINETPESQEIDRQIREYLAKQNSSARKPVDDSEWAPGMKSFFYTTEIRSSSHNCRRISNRQRS